MFRVDLVSFIFGIVVGVMIFAFILAAYWNYFLKKMIEENFKGLVSSSVDAAAKEVLAGLEKDQCSCGGECQCEDKK